MLRITEKTGVFDKRFELRTDDKTVWINHEDRCVARFSPDAVEVGVTHEEGGRMYDRPGKGVGLSEWHQFKKFVHYCYGFVLDDGFRPPWVTNELKPPNLEGESAHE